MHRDHDVISMRAIPDSLRRGSLRCTYTICMHIYVFITLQLRDTFVQYYEVYYVYSRARQRDLLVFRRYIFNFSETAKEFQTYLRKYENDQKLVILEAVNVAGSKLGDNYTSIMIRTKLVGKRGDGSR